MSVLKVCPQCGANFDADQRFCPSDGSTLRIPGTAELIGRVVADRYYILRKLGEGGMGQVYLAEHVRMKRLSAVKIMHGEQLHNATAVARFNREASNASQIVHPHVASIYDFGETDDGLIYLAMEYVEGEPLSDRLLFDGALVPTRAAEIARQVAEALEAAHRLGIVHRDLKPDNIIVGRGPEGEDIAKVVDFGIAKAGEKDGQLVTRTGILVGTPDYMSPEHLSGAEVDGRSDIYSLGLVTFNMMTGALPFASVTSRESLVARLTDTPRTLADRRPDVAWPARLQQVMDRALANDPAKRYQTSREFARDLITAAAETPERITGARAASRSRIRRLPRRLLIAGVSIAALVLIFGLAQAARSALGSASTPTLDSALAEAAAAGRGDTATLPAALRPSLAPIRTDIALARVFADVGRFDSADAHLRSATSQLTRISRHYGGAAEVSTLRRQLGAAARGVHGACDAARRSARRRGAALPACN